MILFFYNLALLTALVAGSPWWLWRMATTQKYRDGMAERLGRVRRELAERAKAAGKPLIWVHAVSVGEVLAVGRLIAELDQALPQYRLVISTTTRTGQALARERFGAGRVFYCPLDLGWAVRAWLNALQPKMLILAETEFWPNLLHGCFRRGIPVVVVNARISDRSWPRYEMLKTALGSDPVAPGPGPRAERHRCPTAEGIGLPAAGSQRCGEPEIRRPGEPGGRGDPAAAHLGVAVRGCGQHPRWGRGGAA